MAPHCLPTALKGMYFVTCNNAVQQCPFLLKTHKKGKRTLITDPFKSLMKMFKVPKLSWAPNFEIHNI